MFDRVAYKKAAKSQLRGRWRVPVLSTLLSAFLFMVFSGALAMVFADSVDVNYDIRPGNFDVGVFSSSESGPFSFFVCLVLAAFVLAQRRLLEVMSKDPAPVSFSDFVDGLNQWWQAIRGFIWQSFWVWLWSLLFVIPGIIKWYSYSMMFYIMAECPKIKVTKAMNISKELTRGYKSDLFVTDLTFIPLFILCLISCGVGFLWLAPYYQAVHTNIYHAVKNFALETKRISLEDFK